MKKRFCSVILVIIMWSAVLAYGAEAWAQELAAEARSPADEVQTLPRPEKKKAKIKVWTGFVGRSDIGNDQGQVEYIRSGLSVSVSRFSFSYQGKSYAWGDRQRLPFGNRNDDPWSELRAVGLKLSHFGALDRKFRYFIGGRLSSSYEQGASGLLGVGAYGGLLYGVSRRWQLSFGMGISHNKVNTNVLPMFGLSWNRGPGGGAAVKGWSASIGFPETSVSYRFNPEVALRLGLSFDKDIYRLSGGSTAQPDGYLETQDAILGLYLDLNPTKRFKVILGVQGNFAREMVLYDRDERHVRTYDLDPAWGGVLNLALSF